MSDNAHIDKTFKDGIGEKDFAGKDALWQKMEATLDRNDRKRKRRLLAFFLITGLLTAGFFIGMNATKNNRNPAVYQAGVSPAAASSKAAVPVQQAANTPGIKQVSEPSATSSINQAGSKPDYIVATDGSTKAGTEVLHQLSVHKCRQLLKASTIAPGVVTTNSTEPAAMPDPGLDKATALDAGLNFEASMDRAEPYLQKTEVLPLNALVNRTTPLKAKQVKPTLKKKISIELIGGTEAFRMNRKAGYYAGIRVNKLLEEGSALSVGVNYSSNTVNDKYRLASKPAEQRETDAKINDLQTLRFPVYFQRQLGNSRVALYAGLIPTYVISATVYNVPNSFNGNPDQFRKFTLSDVNRLNLLFGAGLKYAPLRRVAIELSGSYGFTGLVKDSYTNQSRVNDNFKNIQAGLVFLLK